MRNRLALVLVFATATALGGPALAAPDSAEITYWESVRDSKTPAELEAYLKAYPEGAFSPLARIRLKALQGSHGSTTPEEPTALDTKEAQSTETTETTEDALKNFTLNVKLDKTMIDGQLRTGLGIMIATVADFDSEERLKCFGLTEATGALVTQVSANGPAATAGLRFGDAILKFEGKPVADAKSLAGFVAAEPPGVTVTLTMLRNDAAGANTTEWKVRASAGDAAAMHCFALAHLFGFGVEKNVEEATRWFRKGAEAGNVMAMSYFAINLQNGIGIAKDVEEANRWYRKAAEAGNARAMKNLAANLQKGNGIAKDAEEADRWYRRAGARSPSSRPSTPAPDLGNVKDLDTLE